MIVKLILNLLALLSVIKCNESELKQSLYKVNVECRKDVMEVTVSLNASEDDKLLIYLDKLKGYPDSTCQPKRTGNKLFYSLPIGENFYSCGTIKLRNKRTNTKVFYNRIIIEEMKNGSKDIILVNCIVAHDSLTGLSRSKRQLENEWDFPENFTESIEELIDYSGNITQRAPIPYLNIGVRQNGEFVDTALNVHPGTPLEMIIYLDDESAKVYGILGTFLKVTDKSPSEQEEIIILNGCSIDPYIFSNFQSKDGGNSIFAKFRAFKFPESNFVLFVGTVNVCLKECQGVPCGDNTFGYGKRRKRSIPDELPSDPNKIFEVEMTAFLRIAPSANHTLAAKRVETIKSQYDERSVKHIELNNSIKSNSNSNNNNRISNKEFNILTTKQMPLQLAPFANGSKNILTESINAIILISLIISFYTERI